jgi:hypothetical protein
MAVRDIPRLLVSLFWKFYYRKIWNSDLDKGGVCIYWQGRSLSEEVICPQVGGVVPGSLLGFGMVFGPPGSASNR